MAKILGTCGHEDAVRVCSACVAAMVAVATRKDRLNVEKIEILKAARGIRRPAKPLHRMRPSDCATEMRRHAYHLTDPLPDGTMFCLVAFTDGQDSQGHDAQYVSNAERPGIVAALRQLADRLEA